MLCAGSALPRCTVHGHSVEYNEFKKNANNTIIAIMYRDTSLFSVIAHVVQCFSLGITFAPNFLVSHSC